MPSTQDILRILVIAFFIGAPVIRAIYKWIKKNAEEKRQRDAVERRRLDMLRTGRVDEAARVPAFKVEEPAPSPVAQPSGHEDAKRRLQELARRRQEQLREMARRSQPGVAPGAPPTAAGAPPMVVGRGSTSTQARGTSVPPPAPASRPAKPQHPQTPQRPPNPQQLQQQQQAAARRRAQEKAATKAKAEAARRRAEEDALRRAEEAEADEVPHMPRAGRGMGPDSMDDSMTLTRAGVVAASAVGIPASRVGSPQSFAEWRRAIVMTELLAPPMSMRTGRGEGEGILRRME